MFIVPDKRIDTLWHQIQRQFGNENGGPTLIATSTGDRTRKARIVGTNKRVMMVSWSSLLDRLATAVPVDSVTAQNIRQLLGFVQRQDDEAFLPIDMNELAPALPRRVRALNDLIDEVIDGRIVPKGWISIERRNATPQREGYGRYFRSVGPGGKPVDGDFFLCVNFWLWATQADTPIWLWVSSGVGADASKLRDISAQLVEYGNMGPFDVPIHLQTGQEKQQVLDDIVLQVTEIIKVCKPDHPNLKRKRRGSRNN